VVITGGPDAPTVTDGPFAEAAEVACGYYLFEAENLDEALARARDIPLAAFGAVEVWPTVHSIDLSRKLTGNDWLALLLEPAESAHTPGAPEWEAVAAKHADLQAAASDHILGGAALHDRSTATTVRCATVRSSSPTGHTWKVPKSPPASTCSPPRTATRPSSLPR
jgi:hypothetical protein